MAKRPHHWTREELRRRLYGGWMPEDNSNVWLENGTYRRLMQDLEYLRAHPKQADPARLLELLRQMQEAWKQERQGAKRIMNEMVQQYRQVIELLKEDKQEIDRLNQTIQRIQQALNDAVEQQNRLQQQLNEIHERQRRTAQRAREYRNELVEAFNAIHDDPYLLKYAPDHLYTIQQLIHDIDERDLDEAAIQGLALEGLIKVRSAQLLAQQQRDEYLISYLIAEEQLEGLRQQLDRWQNGSYFDEAQQNRIDMDFWSRGQFSELMQHYKQLHNRIIGSETRPGYMLDHLLADIEQIGRLRTLGEEIVSEVMNVSNLSEELECLANIACYVLCEDFGFRLRNAGFNDGDERESYVLQMENHVLDSKVQFIFTPLTQTQSLLTYNICFARFIDEVLAGAVLHSMLEQLHHNHIEFSELNPNTPRSGIVPDIQLIPKGRPIHITSPIQTNP